MDKNKSKYEELVDYLYLRSNVDSGFRADLRRAAVPVTEHYCWDVLHKFGLNINSDLERRSGSLVASIVGSNRYKRDGKMSIGAALAKCYGNGASSSAAELKMRRLLAVRTNEELCSVLRPLLMLISSRTNQPLDCKRLLKEMVRFENDREAIRVRWASDFYTRSSVEK
ncbi:type I-E CRISPR-associated protein Cse2/CasB [Vibrio barjaei]|uniref:type I-E CRISPR-associated protein Cse2/CasB n=1 Tax=Vibrio barjaei TaxID=1676683 RepID=UPI0022845B80|nr:type I-E CRISPR-associated protein Cse2/CasB [Vibrio barjaei]MCY9874529.1 type I-E CRISPR-associated protein Cse2/CasB [Vibrio barjaei]